MQIKSEKSKFSRKYYKNLQFKSRIQYLLRVSIGLRESMPTEMFYDLQEYPNIAKVIMLN